MLEEWAARHGVSALALADLRRMMGMGAQPPAVVGGQGEAYSQSLVRLEAPRVGVTLWRNNVGALQDKSGRLVRFGLANDSEKLNEVLKSHDLIGWRSVTIEPRHVGTVIAKFVSRECKPLGWHYTGTPREVAQAAWGTLVMSAGGDAAFTTGPGSL